MAIRASSSSSSSSASAPALLVLATPHWEGDYMKSTVALTRELASSYRVLYVEHPPTYTSLGREVLSGQSEQALGALGRCEARMTRVDPEDAAHPIHVLTPPPVWPMNQLPPPLYDRVLLRNAHVVKQAVQTRLSELSMVSPVVLNALNPHYGVALADAFDEQGRVYYCFDEVRARDWNGRHGGRLEDRYISMADAVVGVSSALYDRLSDQHDNAYLVPNGVDFGLFNRAASPEAAPEAPSPCIGYVGTIGDRIDVSLLAQLIRTHPDWQFRFVGRVTEAAVREQLGQYDHVAFTGPKPPEALPDEMRRMDVGLVPFVRNEFTRCMYPLKINEYLAAGLPVVTTAFTDLSDFRGVLSIAETNSQFIEAVAEVVQRPTDPDRRRQRIDVAASNRWAHRADELRVVLDRVRTTSVSASPSS